MKTSRWTLKVEESSILLEQHSAKSCSESDWETRLRVNEMNALHTNPKLMSNTCMWFWGKGVVLSFLSPRRLSWYSSLNYIRQQNESCSQRVVLIVHHLCASIEERNENVKSVGGCAYPIVSSWPWCELKTSLKSIGNHVGAIGLRISVQMNREGEIP